jgi:hypothetical protein
MMRSRSSELQDFLDITHRAMRRAAGADHPARPAIQTIFAALGRVGQAPAATVAARLPVCAQFAPACQAARRHAPEIAALADALSAIEPRLIWTRRAGAAAPGDPFLDNHANARIIGEGGLEPSAEVAIGVSLMAARTTYPDHCHPPEEVYIALSPGDWRQGNGRWRTPGIGGLVHNPPVHAMRSSEAPLLAIWCLRIADAEL